MSAPPPEASPKCCSNRGAAKVYAVDVGHDQLHAKLRADPRVIVLEGTDARDITASLIPDDITALVSDVSFISLEKALPQALARTSPGAILAVLVKPQFESGRDAIGKRAASFATRPYAKPKSTRSEPGSQAFPVGA